MLLYIPGCADCPGPDPQDTLSDAVAYLKLNRIMFGMYFDRVFIVKTHIRHLPNGQPVHTWEDTEDTVQVYTLQEAVEIIKAQLALQELFRTPSATKGA
jgi:hypothetical protein